MDKQDKFDKLVGIIEEEKQNILNILEELKPVSKYQREIITFKDHLKTVNFFLHEAKKL